MDEIYLSEEEIPPEATRCSNEHSARLRFS